MRTDLWTKEEVKFLTENYGKMPFAHLVKTLAKSPAAIRTKLSRVSERSKKQTKWTSEEVAYLEQNVDKMIAKDIAEHLGRTTSSVLGKAAHLGINFTSARVRHSDEDVELCQALHKEGVPLRVIAGKMEISYHTLKSFLYRSHKGHRNIQPARQGQ